MAGPVQVKYVRPYRELEHVQSFRQIANYVNLFARLRHRKSTNGECQRLSSRCRKGSLASSVLALQLKLDIYNIQTYI